MTADQPGDDNLDDLEPPPPEPAAGTAGVDDEAGPGLAYPTVEAWVSDYLAPNYPRDVTEPGSHHHWCREWWKHSEALDRLDALWRAWETLRRDPTIGPATWWTTYADPTMTTLMSPDGPFSRCRRSEHARPDTLVPPLPVTAAPVGLFSADA